MGGAHIGSGEDLLKHCTRKRSVLPNGALSDGRVRKSELAILFWGLDAKDASIYSKDICSAMFISALFIIARNWE